ncbi:hypothetical protein ZHAS_00008950 [Anopheles sinensis]|uniref:Uncharacterized protein n=1 Tax=Anopheles sinensis TaxID=74873 RepID=A0A084VTS5_ANOSI|nr:hypothetical protein ZHAS_00008950 [Anopheles sinensis]
MKQAKSRYSEFGADVTADGYAMHAKHWRTLGRSGATSNGVKWFRFFTNSSIAVGNLGGRMLVGGVEEAGMQT